MLGDISVVSELYIVCGYTDMRKSIDVKRRLILSADDNSAPISFHK